MLYDAGSSNEVLRDNLEGWRWEGGSRGRGHMYILTADSCCYMAETNIVL